MKKLNIRVILLQLLGIILLIHGILQLKFYTVAEEIICAANHFQDQKSECWNRLFPTMESNLSFWPGVYIWIFLGLFAGIIIITFLNWKNKLSPLNTILISAILYILLRFKFFREGRISHLLSSFGGLFSDNFKTQCLIGGISFTFIGILILWISVNQNLFNFKKH
ncbi:hypothetical protein [Flavobacterium hydrophilum]|uniref:Uncharacterized protein n=1 Tax=Flavobacterium hydrophilum TaxID=2211445 RepID=A0A2V4BYQ9_9FLAO|nr:hypothetical protein [Flavobacterium hydrophilum]PXY44161.1 hypothetical protein DMB68_17145 [Flavobacterium hydrophilum]